MAEYQYNPNWEIELEVNENQRWKNYGIEPDPIGLYYFHIISDKQYRVIRRLARRTPRAKNKWRYITERQIAKETGFSQKKVQTIIKELEKRGLLKVKRGGPKKANRYSIKPFSKACKEKAKADGYYDKPEAKQELDPELAGW